MPSDFLLDRFRSEDVFAFLAMAEREGWICDRWEFEFHFATFPGGCRVARLGDEPVAFVTAVKYDRSGWIGNLLVSKVLRGKGLGRMLMNEALAALARAGAETVWLTASADGRLLYETLGFKAIDNVIRWRGNFPRKDVRPETGFPEADVEEIDRCGWGDRRCSILKAVAGRGTVIAGSAGFLMLQPTGAGLQIGPWGCRVPEEAARLLDAAGSATGGERAGEVEAFLDSPATNRPARRLLQREGFAACGETVLMYRGLAPGYNSSSIFALASMGSMG